VVPEGTEQEALARRLLLEKYGGRPGSGDLSTWGRSAMPVAIEWPAGTSYTSLG
jgi:hypothetical protein